MARLEYFLVAENVVIDRQTNQVSAFNILEDLSAPSFPARIPKAVALTLWCTETGDQDRASSHCFVSPCPTAPFTKPAPTSFRAPLVTV